GRIHAVSDAQTVQAARGGGLGLALVWRTGVWGMLGGWIAGTLVARATMRRAASDIPIAPGSFRGGLAIARAGLPVFGYFALTLLLRSVDRLALVHAGVPGTLGLYGLGLMTSITLLHLPEAAAYVLFP